MVFGASLSLPLLLEWERSWTGQQMKRPHCFRRTLMLISAEIVFTNCILCSVAFRPSFNRRLLLDLDSYGGNDPDGVF